MRPAFLRRIFCMLFAAALLCGLLPAASPAAQAARLPSFQIAQARKLALAESRDISSLYNKLILQNTKYDESIKEIKAKIKNKKSFRWTPLLSFKFPEQFDLAEEYEINIDPLKIQVEISKLRHELQDKEHEVLEAVNLEYINVYILQEKIAFYEELLAAAQQELAVNQARLVTGDARQADIDVMESRISDLTKNLSELKRSFESGKAELGDMCGLDLSTGFHFKNPLMGLTVDRSWLEQIIQHTLDNDHLLYTTKMDRSVALMTMDLYQSLMSKQYGSKLNGVVSYVNMVRKGQEVDYAAFKLVYDDMLRAVDQPWNGKIRILFFSFTLEWFKGSISGTRYVEDDMYALYVASQEYEAANREVESTESDLRKQVTSAFESLITARNSYVTLTEALARSREDLDKTASLNRLGKADYDELATMQESYQDAQLEAIDALASYNELLVSFDRLTCGAVTKLMTGESFEMDAGVTGQSNVQQLYYNIDSQIEDMVFRFSLEVPDDYEPEISDYEIWYEDTQIGERMPVSQSLRHLTLDYGEDSLLLVRLYNGDDFVAECEIDTTITRDVLRVEGGGVLPPEPEQQLGTYSVSTKNMGDLSTSELRFEFDSAFGIKSYTLSYMSAGRVLTTEVLDVSNSFHYLTILVASLADVSVDLYDRSGELLYTARLDTEKQTVMAPLAAEE